MHYISLAGFVHAALGSDSPHGKIVLDHSDNRCIADLLPDGFVLEGLAHADYHPYVLVRSGVGDLEALWNARVTLRHVSNR